MFKSVVGNKETNFQQVRFYLYNVSKIAQTSAKCLCDLVLAGNLEIHKMENCIEHKQFLLYDDKIIIVYIFKEIKRT